MRHSLPYLIAFLIRALALTIRIRIDDRCGITRGEVKGPVIWAFWHNRILLVPVVYRRHCSGRRGFALTSPSKDGAILAKVMDLFGLGTVRGSSSRRGVTALRELAAILGRGDDVAITPDGPRGPMYKLSPGIVKLAQVAGAPILPMHVRYNGYWRLGSWDAFRIPHPFSGVEFVFGPLHTVEQTSDDASFAAQCERLERMLVEGKDASDAKRKR